MHFVDYSSLGYGNRIGLFPANNTSKIKVNPRQEIGKFGIKAYSNRLSLLFRKTIAFDATDANTGESKKLYLNRSSAIKWINAQVDEGNRVNSKDSDSDIISKINNIGNLVLNQAPSNASENHLKINDLIVKIRCIFWKIMIKLTYSCWPLFALRLKFLSRMEKGLQQASKSLACGTYKNAKKYVDAYKHFVTLPSNEGEITNFNSIPISSKDNYIKKYTKLRKYGELSLYNNRIIPKGAKKDTSTGTSGQPTSWYRGPKEVEIINRTISLSTKAVIGNKPYYLINGFALGPWATGITIANAASNDPNATVCNIGFDTKQIFQAIKDAVKVLPENHPIIITGYPPHLKEVVDLAVEENFPLNEHNIIGIVGGESLSENQRNLINSQLDSEGHISRTGFKKCYSAYGASDLDVAIGYETDFSIELRKVLHENHELAKELLGDNEFVPMIFPYDPLNYHIETDEDQNLIFTCVRGDRISPRVRYNLGDRGKTMPLSDVLATLKKHHVELKNSYQTNLPLLFVWGRAGSHITIDGVNIAPENLEDALRDQDLLTGIHRYGFLQYEEEGNRVTEILIETEQDTEINQVDFHKKVIDGLKRYNQEFNKLMNEHPKPPRLRILKKGEGPMALQRKRYPHRKVQYIFRKGDEFVQNITEVGGTLYNLQ